VTKFTKFSIFKDRNQQNDILMDIKYSEICGITDDEPAAGFDP